jgi:hypothetical protein
MAVDAPKQGTRRASRLKVAGRLFALLGLPLMVCFGLFAGGVYVGALRSHRVQVLEAEYLGFDPPAGSGDAATPIGVGEQPDTQANPDAAEQPKPEPAKPEPAKPEPAKPDVAEQPKPDPAPSVAALPTAVADPVGAELRTLFDAPLRMRVKLLVDRGLLVGREDWLSYSASLIHAADASFRVLFGVQVELQGVVVWDRPAGADPAALLAELTTREREGADVVVGLVADTAPAGYQPQAWPEAHGDHALVFADLRTRDRYYRNLLRSLAGLLGATRSEQISSFMSDAEPTETAPVLDPDNRGRVIFNKQRPFVSSQRHPPAQSPGPSRDADSRPNQPEQPQPQGEQI